MTVAKTLNDWRNQFLELNSLGAVEVRLKLRGILENCVGYEVSCEDNYSEVVKTIEEFDTLISDPTVSKITSIRPVSKKELKIRGIL